MAYASVTFQVIKAAPTCPEDCETLQITADTIEIVKGVDDVGIAWAYFSSEALFYYALHFETDGGDPEGMKVELWKEYNFTSTLLDSFTAPAISTGDQFEDLVVDHECATGVIDVSMWLNGTTEYTLSATDTAINPQEKAVGFLVGDDNHTEHATQYLQISNIAAACVSVPKVTGAIALAGSATVAAAAQSAPSGQRADLQATATVSAVGESFNFKGETDLQATATVGATGSVNAVTIDVTGYRIGTHNQSTTETSVWEAALNTYVAAEAGVPYRLRWLLENTDLSTSSGQFGFKLQAREIDIRGNATAWVDADTATSWLKTRHLGVEETEKYNTPISVYSSSGGYLYGDGVYFYEENTDTTFVFANYGSGISAPVICKMVGLDTTDNPITATHVHTCTSTLTCRSAKFTRCGNGDILLFTYGPSTTYYARYFRSTDDGVTWGTAQTVNDTTQVTSGEEDSIDVYVNPSSGKIWLLCGGKYMITSTDHGSTWDASWVTIHTHTAASTDHGYFPHGVTEANMSVVSYGGASSGIYWSSLDTGTWTTSAIVNKRGVYSEGGRTHGTVYIQPTSTTDMRGLTGGYPLSHPTKSYVTTMTWYAIPRVGKVYTSNNMDSGRTEGMFVTTLPASSGDIERFTVAMLDFNYTSNESLVFQSNVDVDLRLEGLVYNLLLKTAIVYNNPTTPSSTSFENETECHESAIALELGYHASIGNHEYCSNGTLMYSVISTDDSVAGTVITKFLPIDYHSMWFENETTITQKLGSGTFTAPTKPYFAGNQYPLIGIQQDTIDLPAGNETEIETAIVVPTILESNTTYQLRLMPLDYIPPFVRTEYNDDWEYIQTNGTFPTSWVNSPTGADAGWSIVLDNSSETWIRYLRAPNLSSVGYSAQVDIANPLPVAGRFVINIDDHSVSGDNAVHIDWIDDSGTATNIHGDENNIAYDFIQIAAEVPDKVTAPYIRLRFEAETTVDEFSWASASEPVFYAGDYSGVAPPTNSKDLVINNTVYASFKKDSTSALLAGTATLTAQAAPEGQILGAISLNGTATLAPAGEITGGIAGHWSKTGVATISAVATKGETKTFAASLSANATVNPLGTAAKLELKAFRWRDNNGTETSATWAGLLNANPVLPPDTMHRLRLGLYNTATIDDTEMGVVGLEMSVNGGAWQTAETITGAVRCCEPAYEVDTSLDIDGLDGEDVARSPMLMEESNGRWHLFYCSRDTGTTNYYMRHRRWNGVTWDTFNDLVHPQSPSTIIYQIAGRMLETSTGDLHYFFQSESGNGIFVTTSTNGGSAWTDFELAVQYTYGVLYWDAVIDSNDKMWLSFQMWSDSFREWTYSGCRVSTNGTDWNTPEGLIRNDITLNSRLGMVSYFQSNYTGIRADIVYQYLYSPTMQMKVERYKWDGVTDGEYPYEEDGEVTWEPYEQTGDFYKRTSFAVTTPETTRGHNFPRIELFHIQSYGDDRKHFTSVNQNYTSRGVETPEHWDGTWNFSYRVAYNHDIHNHQTNFDGELVMHTYSSADGPISSFMDYEGKFNLYFTGEDFVANMAGADVPGFPITHHPHSNKVYLSFVDNTDSTTIKFAQLNSPDLSGTGLDLWDNGVDTTQQITTGSFLSTNKAFSMLGTAGHSMRDLPANTYLEMEFFVKLNSDVVGQGDTVCFRVPECDSYPVGYPCLTIVTERVDLQATATISATGFTDGPKCSLASTATLSATAGLSIDGQISLAGSASVVAPSSIIKTFATDLRGTAQTTSFAVCSKFAAVDFTGTATIETLSLSVVKATASFNGVASTLFAAPVVQVICKASLTGVSNLTPHGNRTTTGKVSLKAFAYMGVRRSALGSVDSLISCLNVYKRDEELVIVKEGVVEVEREGTLVIQKPSDVVLGVRKVDDTFTVINEV